MGDAFWRPAGYSVRRPIYNGAKSEWAAKFSSKVIKIGQTNYTAAALAVFVDENQAFWAKIRKSATSGCTKCLPKHLIVIRKM